jgi:hypothetical protein
LRRRVATPDLATSLRGDVLEPRALAAFVKRPQAALLKSALDPFYRTGKFAGQTNVVIDLSRLYRRFFYPKALCENTIEFAAWR